MRQTAGKLLIGAVGVFIFGNYVALEMEGYPPWHAVYAKLFILIAGILVMIWFEVKK